jgi:hypothetical protein
MLITAFVLSIINFVNNPHHDVHIRGVRTTNEPGVDARQYSNPMTSSITGTIAGETYKLFELYWGPNILKLAPGTKNENFGADRNAYWGIWLPNWVETVDLQYNDFSITGDGYGRFCPKWTMSLTMAAGTSQKTLNDFKAAWIYSHKNTGSDFEFFDDAAPTFVNQDGTDTILLTKTPDVRTSKVATITNVTDKDGAALKLAPLSTDTTYAIDMTKNLNFTFTQGIYAF